MEFHLTASLLLSLNIVRHIVLINVNLRDARSPEHLTTRFKSLNDKSLTDKRDGPPHPPAGHPCFAAPVIALVANVNVKRSNLHPIHVIQEVISSLSLSLSLSLAGLSDPLRLSLRRFKRLTKKG